MKNTLRPGLSGELDTHVGPGQTIALGGLSEATVFSTPSMISLMEYCARQLLEPHLEADEESVGVDVHIAHTSATPPGNKVTACATVLEVEKNVVLFEVVAEDDWGEIGRGRHRRAVIRTSKFAEKLAEQKKASGTIASSPEFKLLHCQRAGQMLTVSLNRPSKKNAMNQALTLELEQLLGVLNASPNETRVVVFRGSNENFSAGDDIGDIPEDAREAEELSLRRGALYQAITMSPQVFVAEIDGLCLGGALVLASACDFRISSQRASFGLPEVTLGWPPNYGMGIVLSLIGRAAGMELALTGRRLHARDAASLGLVNEVVPHTQLSEFAQQYATKMLQLPAEAIKEIKRLLAPGEVWSDQTATQAFMRCLKTDTAIENLRRFRPSS